MKYCEITILDRLEKTAEQYPERIAVSDPAGEATWQGLQKRAFALGSALYQMLPGARKREGEFPVAILADKSVSLLEMMLGVTYCGGFYVILNPEQPAERIQKILEVLDPAIVITEEKYKNRMEQTGYRGGK